MCSSSNNSLAAIELLDSVVALCPGTDWKMYLAQIGNYISPINLTLALIKGAQSSILLKFHFADTSYLSSNTCVHCNTI